MSHRNLDKKGRFRCRTVGFRVSPEESDRIDFLVAASGLTKQDYIVRRLEGTEVVVVPSSRVQRKLEGHMGRIYLELRRLEDASEVDEELAEQIVYLSRYFSQLEKSEKSPETTAKDAIAGLER